MPSRRWHRFHRRVGSCDPKASGRRDVPYHPVEIQTGYGWQSPPKRGEEAAIVKHHRINDQASLPLLVQLYRVPAFVDEEGHIPIPQVKGHPVAHYP